jgi:type VI protein secretion system component VasF
MQLAPEALDKRLALLEQALSLGFEGIRADMGKSFGEIARQNDMICNDLSKIEDRLSKRLDTLEKRATEHERALLRVEPWITGLEKALWIVVGIILVAAVGGIGWAIVQSGALH